MADLESRLAGHSAYFNSLVELVPAKYYLPDDEEEKFNKFHQNRKHKAPKQAIKEASKKAKRARLNPGEHKSILELQVEKEHEEEAGSSESEHESVPDRFRLRLGSGNSERINGNSDLRTNLHSKIQQLRMKRKAGNQKRKNRPKKKTKLEVKEKKKKENANSSVRGPKPPQGPGDKVVFSKFDFISQNQEKAQKSGSKIQNYKKLLAQAEARKSSLQKMKGTDAKKAKEVSQKHTWKTALLKAEGGKPKDDPKLLKKAIKRREKRKEKSKKQWKAREDHVKMQKEEKQRRRKQHLKERSDGKKMKGKRGKKSHKPGF